MTDTARPGSTARVCQGDVTDTRSSWEYSKGLSGDVVDTAGPESTVRVWSVRGSSPVQREGAMELCRAGSATEWTLLGY